MQRFSYQHSSSTVWQREDDVMAWIRLPKIKLRTDNAPSLPLRAFMRSHAMGLQTKRSLAVCSVYSRVDKGELGLYLRGPSNLRTIIIKRENTDTFLNGKSYIFYEMLLPTITVLFYLFLFFIFFLMTPRNILISSSVHTNLLFCYKPCSKESKETASVNSHHIHHITTFFANMFFLSQFAFTLHMSHNPPQGSWKTRLSFKSLVSIRIFQIRIHQKAHKEQSYCKPRQ